jgi:hypothetical protein
MAELPEYRGIVSDCHQFTDFSIIIGEMFLGVGEGNAAGEVVAADGGLGTGGAAGGGAAGNAGVSRPVAVANR